MSVHLAPLICAHARVFCFSITLHVTLAPLAGQAAGVQGSEPGGDRNTSSVPWGPSSLRSESCSLLMRWWALVITPPPAPSPLEGGAASAQSRTLTAQKRILLRSRKELLVMWRLCSPDPVVRGGWAPPQPPTLG